MKPKIDGLQWKILLENPGGTKRLHHFSMTMTWTAWTHPGGKAMAPQQGMALGTFLRYCSQLLELRLEGRS